MCMWLGMASSPSCMPGRDPQEGPASSADALDRPLGHRPLLSVFGGTVSLWSCQLHGAAGPRGWMQEHGVQGWVCRWHPQRQAGLQIHPCVLPRPVLSARGSPCLSRCKPHGPAPAGAPPALGAPALLRGVTSPLPPLDCFCDTQRGCTGICLFLTHPIAITYLPVPCLPPPLALPLLLSFSKPAGLGISPWGRARQQCCPGFPLCGVSRPSLVPVRLGCLVGSTRRLRGRRQPAPRTGSRDPPGMHLLCPGAGVRGQPSGDRNSNPVDKLVKPQGLPGV